MRLKCPNFCHFRNVLKRAKDTKQGFLVVEYHEDSFDPGDFPFHAEFEVVDADFHVENELLCDECHGVLEKVGAVEISKGDLRT